MDAKAVIARAGLVAVLGAVHAPAQEPPFTPVDRIVAIVGKKPIMLSRINEELNIIQREQPGFRIPTDSAELHKIRLQMINELIDEELLIQEASRDTTIKVNDQQVQSDVEQQVRTTREKFASELDYQRELRGAGFGSPEEYRRFVTDHTRRRMIQQALMQKARERGDVRSWPPTDQELAAAFEQQRTRRDRPATITFRHIVIRATGDSAAIVSARHEADSVLAQLRRGADFATLARRHSDDPGSREQGGELGWFRRGSGMVPEFERAAFRLRPGQISDVVRSPDGFHIIQAERVDPAEMQARHILIAPAITDADRARARARADTVVAQLRAGTAPDSIVRLYNDPTEQSLAEDVPRDSLPQVYRDALATADSGSVVGPVELDPGTTRTRYAVMLVQTMRPAGEYTFDEVREVLRSNLANQKGVRRFMDGLRQKAYVRIRL